MPSPSPLAKISLPSALARISAPWQPKLVASLNGTTELKVAKLKGSFLWHSHSSTDEVFYLLSGGPLTVQFHPEDGGDVVLEVGEMLVVPKGVHHCPKAEEECSVLIVEEVGTANDGGEESAFKAVVEDFRN